MSERPSNKIVPPLQNGDRLNRAEFERRYHAYPNGKKFELIDGVVFMASPVTHAFHGSPHADVIGWLYNYRRRTPGVQLADNATIKLGVRSAPQPDGYLYIEATSGGRVQLDSDGYVVGVPELVVEISASSASLDANAKKTMYQSSGVNEYILWRVYDAALDWFVNRDGTFEPLTTSDGILRSETFPGLWLLTEALFAEDANRVEAVLTQGLASPEHAAFVQRLRTAQGATP